MEVEFQFLEIHDSVQSSAAASCIKRPVRGSAVDGLVDVIADANAQPAVPISHVDRSSVLRGSLPLGGTSDAGLSQRHHLRLSS